MKDFKKGAIEAATGLRDPGGPASRNPDYYYQKVLSGIFFSEGKLK